MARYKSVNDMIQAIYQSDLDRQMTDPQASFKHVETVQEIGDRINENIKIHETNVQKDIIIKELQRQIKNLRGF